MSGGEKKVPFAQTLKDLKQSSKDVTPPSAASVDNEKVTLSFETFEVGSAFCLGKHEKVDVSDALACFRKLTERTWAQVLATSGKGSDKKGLRWTPYDDAALKGAHRPSWLSKDITVNAISATMVHRIYGYRKKATFFVLWFDKKHDIVPYRP